MYNEIKLKVVNAVWANPVPAFGCQFRKSRDYQQNERGGIYDEAGKIRIRRTSTGANIWVYYNGSSRQSGDLFSYLQDYHLNTANYADTLRTLAGLYNIPVEVSKEEQEALNRLHLAREVAPYLIKALQDNPTGETYQYVTKSRRMAVEGVYLGELSADAIRKAEEGLKARGKSWTAADLRALGLTEERIKAGYTLVIPYYHCGVIQGFVYRNIRPNLPTSTPRYLYSEGLGRLGYCADLSAVEVAKDGTRKATPAVIVEGQLDALRLMQVGVKNVIALGGANIGANISRLLAGRGFKEIIYIPDHETDAQGNRKTELINKAITALQAVEAEGEPVIKALYVADLPAPVKAGGKVDADSYGAESPQELRGLVELGTVEAWRWQIDRVTEQVAAQEQAGERVQVAELTDTITKVYICNHNPYTRQRMRDHLNTCKGLAKYGITSQALADLDGWRAKREYNDRVRAAAKELTRAVEAEATPEQVGAIIRKLSDTQGNDARKEWEAQTAQTFDEELAAIRHQPETLPTKWELGRLGKTGQYCPTGRIEFYPADITVFCAPTSHGKTMILFEAALDLLRRNDEKVYLFVSCEENKRQLLERAINVYLDIPTTADGHTSTGEYCFIRGTRKKTIRAAIRNDVAPYEYAQADGFIGESAHYNAIREKILRGVEAYGRHIRPRLPLIHTEASAESICRNILHSVEDYRAQGVEVGGVFIDYMQLLTSEGNTYSRHDELKDICKALKDCAARTELPIIIAAQLNRDVLKKEGIDSITVANIGEGADIERIAHDVFLLWQVDKTPLQPYITEDKTGTLTEPQFDRKKVLRGYRSRRMFSIEQTGGYSTETPPALKEGYIYIEQLKARDGITGGWGLFPYDGERGQIGILDEDIMKK